MVWFLVDDNLALHAKADRAGNAAMGLWVRTGAWSAGNLTDGFVPTRIARQIGTETNIESLVKSGLWSRVTGGFQFHDWADRQPTAEQVRQRREDARKRKAKQRQNQQPVPRDPHARARPSPSKDLVTNTHQGAAPAPPAQGGASHRKPADPFDEIANCDLCDDEARKPNGMPCDHIDRTESHANGMAAVQEAINEAKTRKAILQQIADGDP